MYDDETQIFPCDAQDVKQANNIEHEGYYELVDTYVVIPYEKLKAEYVNVPSGQFHLFNDELQRRKKPYRLKINEGVLGDTSDGHLVRCRVVDLKHPLPAQK